MAGTQACGRHQGKWQQHLSKRKKQTLGGYRRALRIDEALPWIPQSQHNTQPHDQPESSDRRAATRDHFIPPRMYCVETLCAPCGVVIAWAKFLKSESPTNILNFLEHVYPTEGSRPSYICIDKACLVLRTCVSNGSWESWRKSSRFIVDTYHYSNHRVEDRLCQKWCNPAPLDGSAPNLVVVETNTQGRPYYNWVWAIIPNIEIFVNIPMGPYSCETCPSLQLHCYSIPLSMDGKTLSEQDVLNLIILRLFWTQSFFCKSPLRFGQITALLSLN